ncbi:putative membrane protein, partial [Candidatus Erwinia dacicola]
MDIFNTFCGGFNNFFYYTNITGIAFKTFATFQRGNYRFMYKFSFSGFCLGTYTF